MSSRHSFHVDETDGKICVCLKQFGEWKVNTEKIRKSFKPEKINILFVGESPPTSGRFFYTQSKMTTFTARAFETVFDRSFDGPADFLVFFQAQGCYLEDLTEIPIDKMPRVDREKILTKQVARFSKKLKKLQPEAIVIVLKKIAPCVRGAVRIAGLSCPVYVLPFPGQSHQTKYIQELCGILEKRLQKQP